MSLVSLKVAETVSMQLMFQCSNVPIFKFLLPLCSIIPPSLLSWSLCQKRKLCWSNLDANVLSLSSSHHKDFSFGKFYREMANQIVHLSQSWHSFFFFFWYYVFGVISALIFQELNESICACHYNGDSGGCQQDDGVVCHVQSMSRKARLLKLWGVAGSRWKVEVVLGENAEWGCWLGGDQSY